MWGQDILTFHAWLQNLPHILHLSYSIQYCVILYYIMMEQWNRIYHFIHTTSFRLHYSPCVWYIKTLTRSSHLLQNLQIIFVKDEMNYFNVGGEIRNHHCVPGEGTKPVSFSQSCPWFPVCKHIYIPLASQIRVKYCWITIINCLQNYGWICLSALFCCCCI